MLQQKQVFNLMFQGNYLNT